MNDELVRAFGRLEAKVDNVTDVCTDTANRVREIEKREATRSGWAMGVSAVVAFCVSFVKDFVR